MVSYNNIEKWLLDFTMNKIQQNPEKNLDETLFYTLAHDTFMEAVGVYETNHPEIKDDSDQDSGEMWYDGFLDNGIVSGIMGEMLEVGFTMKEA